MAVALGLVSTGPLKAQIILDNGFESPDLGSGSSAYAYGDQAPLSTTDTGWTFVSGAGIAANGSAFDVEGATKGQTSDSSESTSGQAGFLQGLSSISQTLSLSAGNYVFTFDAEGRGGVFFPEFIANEVTVSLVSNAGTIQLYDATPAPTFFSLQTTSMTGVIAAGDYTLVFSGVTNADATSFIDNVDATNLDPLAAPEPASVAIFLMEIFLLVALLRLRRRALN